MAYSSHLITAPIGIYDVQRALGTSANDVGNLCVRTNINMWARYKPIKYQKIAQLTSTEWNNARHGVYRSSSLPLFNTNGRLNHDVWTYDRPTGGSASPYRLTDFNRYYHVAPCPVKLIFSTDILTILNTSDQNIISFAFTFEQGISMWRSDDCCLYMRDIFYNSTSLNRYLTVGIVHYITNNYVGYFKSSDYKLSNYIADSSQQLSNAPVANVLVDLADFKTKMQSTYLTDGTKWEAVMFLCSSKLDGATSITTGETELLQYDGTVTQDSDGYEEGCDRHIMTVKNASWASEITGMTVATTYEKDGATQYKISQVVITVTRAANSPARSFSLECEAICIGGAMSNSQQQTSGEFNVGILSFSANQTSESVTLLASTFTSYKYQFDRLGSGAICHAILRAGISLNGAERSVATDADLASGPSSLTVTNSL